MFEVVFGDLSELSVDDIVVSFGLVAGEGVLGVGAGEGVLAEDGLVAAEEGVLGGFDDLSGVVFDGQADVEDPAVVGDVSVVPVGTAFASEGLGGLPDDVEVPVGERVGALGCDSGHQEGEGEGDGLHLRLVELVV